MNTQLSEFLASEIEQYKGVLVPVKAGFLERVFVRKVPTDSLHPNPDDEFCDPDIGPNYGIVTDYVKTINRFGTLMPDPEDEPIIVEKVHPDGYMILNGHHRWAAALSTGLYKVPVSIVNLTHEIDIEKMIRESKHDRQVTLDLDEVVFCSDEDTLAEKSLPFPYNKLYKERIRYGIPALLHLLSVQGYDVWVYTAKYYSYEYIRAYFKKYSVKLDGIITGTALKTSNRMDEKKRTEKLFANQYSETLHIDENAILRTRRKSGEFEEYPIDAEPSDWSRIVMTILERMK